MIPFLLKENHFSFFVADHLLVGQLCTNPKSDRSLLSCLKVTQCPTSQIGDAPLYNSSTNPSYDNRTIASTLRMQIWMVQPWGHSSTHWMNLWRWWSRRTLPGSPGPRSPWKRSRQSLMKLLSGLFGRLPEILKSHTQLWMYVWRRTWSVGPTGARQARSWLKRQRTSG